MAVSRSAVIRLQFVLGVGLASRAIAWYSSGGFSHVDIVTPNGFLLGARSDVIEVDGEPDIPAGVHIRPADYAPFKKRVLFELPATELQAARFYRFANSQIGKPYDKTAIWGFAAGRDWRQDDSWFCSEFGAACAERSGIVPKLYSPLNKITPAALALALSAAGADAKELPLAA